MKNVIDLDEILEFPGFIKSLISKTSFNRLV